MKYILALLILGSAAADPIFWTADPTSSWDESENRSAIAIPANDGMVIGATCNSTDLNGCFLGFTADRPFTVMAGGEFNLSTVIPASLVGYNCAINVPCFPTASVTSELSGSTAIFTSEAGPSGFVTDQSLSNSTSAAQDCGGAGATCAAFGGFTIQANDMVFLGPGSYDLRASYQWQIDGPWPAGDASVAVSLIATPEPRWMVWMLALGLAIGIRAPNFPRKVKVLEASAK
jgi:hypothetical protein